MKNPIATEIPKKSIIEELTEMCEKNAHGSYILHKGIDIEKMLKERGFRNALSLETDEQNDLLNT